MKLEVKFVFARYEEIEAIFREVQSTFCRVVSVQAKELHNMLTLFFYTAAKFIECCSTDPKKISKDSVIQDMINQVYQLVSKWIDRQCSYYAFGDPAKITTRVKFHGHKEELKVFYTCTFMTSYNISCQSYTVNLCRICRLLLY